MSFVDDLPNDYGNYNASTGAGSAAVEFLPTSITRGNFDEAGFGGFLATLAQAAIALANPHHVFSELESHGYGILDIRPARTIGEFWYSGKGSITSNESFNGGYQVLNGDNHWDRSSIGSPSVYNPMILSIEDEAQLLKELEIFPQPGNDQITVRLQMDYPGSLKLKVTEVATGKEVIIQDLGLQEAGVWKSYIFRTEDLASGVYLLQLEGAEKIITRKISIQHR